MQISDRQQKLLMAIIEEFIETADAVASLNLPRKYGLPLSSATIRNEMKSLSDAGYLRQIHTSSGRVPTTSGLRFFIEQIRNELEELAMLEQEKIRHQLFDLRFSPEELIRFVLKSLVRLTGNPAFLLVGKEVFYAGLADMLDIPEFQDLARLKRILRILEDYATLLKVLNQNRAEGRVKILVGEELGIKDLEEYAVVFSQIHYFNDTNGFLCVIGPNRMNYRSVIPVIDYMSATLSQALKGW